MLYIIFIIVAIFVIAFFIWLLIDSDDEYSYDDEYGGLMGKLKYIKDKCCGGGD